MAEHICPAVNLLRDAHIELEVAWAFVRRSSQGSAEALANLAWGYEPNPDAVDDDDLTFQVSNADAPAIFAGVRP